MLTEPTIELRPSCSYLAIPAAVTMATIGAELPPLIARVLAQVAAHGVGAAGAPFWRYRVIDMAGTLRVDVGVPTASASASAVAADGDFESGTLPAGRYATAVHTGHPADLEAATAALLAWAETRGLPWDSHSEPDGEHWACRLEEYLTDPAVEPDMHNWQTRLAFKLAP